MKKLEEMSFNERLVRQAIVEKRNEIVGGFENAFSDNGEEMFLKEYGIITRQDIINTIYDEIMSGNNNGILLENGLYLEKKHIKFLGKDFIQELIKNRVDYDYKKNGWDFPHKF